LVALTASTLDAAPTDWLEGARDVGSRATVVHVDDERWPQHCGISQRRELHVPSLLGPGGGSPSAAFLDVGTAPLD
jgi:hypothetical protein